MSLDFNCSINNKQCIKNPELLTFDEYDMPNGLAKVLIFATMWVDLGEITEKNLDEWMFRLKVIESRGYLRSEKIGDEWRETPIRREEVEGFIGLRTNVSSITRAEFKKRQWKILEETVNRSVRSEKERLEESKEEKQVA